MYPQLFPSKVPTAPCYPDLPPAYEEHPAPWESTSKPSWNRQPPPDLVAGVATWEGEHNICTQTDTTSKHQSAKADSAVIPADPLEQPKKNRRIKIKRALWCIGWVLLCPLFCVGSLAREYPEDEEDWNEETCLYPCLLAHRHSNCNTDS